MMRSISSRINLTHTRQIIIVDSEYTSYVKEQAKNSIIKIGQINFITAHFLIFYDFEIEKKIKHCYHK